MAEEKKTTKKGLPLATPIKTAPSNYVIGRRQQIMELPPVTFTPEYQYSDEEAKTVMISLGVELIIVRGQHKTKNITKKVPLSYVYAYPYTMARKHSLWFMLDIDMELQQSLMAAPLSEIANAERLGKQGMIRRSKNVPAKKVVVSTEK